MFSSPCSTSNLPAESIAGSTAVVGPVAPKHGKTTTLPAVEQAVSVLSTHLLEFGDTESPCLLSRLGSQDTAHRVNKILDHGKALHEASLLEHLDWTTAKHEALQRSAPVASSLGLNFSRAQVSCPTTSLD